MSSKELTCAERINDALASREQFVEGLFDAIDNDTEHEEVVDPLDFLSNEFHLDIEKMIVVKILMSTGGPGDWLECYCQEYEGMYRLEYHFNDWFDHAQVKVDENSPLWRYAEMIVESVLYS